MVATNLTKVITDKYVKAFIAVAEMLEPNILFSDVIDNIHAKGDSVSRDIAVTGFSDETLVQVSKEQHPTKGLQIVVTYIDIETQEVKSSRSVWYFSFNWKGLMACVE